MKRYIEIYLLFLIMAILCYINGIYFFTALKPFLGIMWFVIGLINLLISDLFCKNIKIVMKINKGFFYSMLRIQMFVLFDY